MKVAPKIFVSTAWTRDSRAVSLRDFPRPIDVVREWVLESYSTIAPRELVAELDSARSTLAP